MVPWWVEEPADLSLSFSLRLSHSGDGRIPLNHFQTDKGIGMRAPGIWTLSPNTPSCPHSDYRTRSLPNVGTPGWCLTFVPDSNRVSAHQAGASHSLLGFRDLAGCRHTGLVPHIRLGQQLSVGTPGWCLTLATRIPRTCKMSAHRTGASHLLLEV